MTAETDGGSAGLGSIGAFVATANVGGSTTAYLGGGSTLTVGNLAVTANASHNVSSTTTAVVVGALAGSGSSSTTTVAEDVEAYLGTPANATPSSTPTTYAPQGTVTVTAATSDTGASKANGGLAGVGAISGDIADSIVKPTVKAYVSDNVNVSTPDNLTVSATATNNATSNIIGVVVSAYGVGVSAGQTTDSATLAAYVGHGTFTVGGNLSISATSTDTATTNSQSSGGSFVASGGGAVADATINPNVQAYAGDSTGGATIDTTGTAAITARETPKADAIGLGIQASLGLAVGVVTSDASVSGNTESYLGDNSAVTASSLTIQATQDQDANSDPTATSSSTAGSGGVLAGVDATSSTASTSGFVVARTGNDVSLNCGVSISAQNTTDQNAWAHGDAAGGALGVGDCSSNASSNVTTNAFLGAGATMGSQAAPDGALAITATGSDSNAAASTAGAGGVVSGDCARLDGGRLHRHRRGLQRQRQPHKDLCQSSDDPGRQVERLHSQREHRQRVRGGR